jgi:glucan 1,3-beta-glucosidase
LSSWIAVALVATTSGILLGIAQDKMFYESYGIGGWLHWGALLAAGVVASVLGANALVSGRSLPTFLDMFGPRGEGSKLALSMWCLGASLVVTTLIASETALGFVFDPRYRDFPFASLTMAVIPFACLLLNRPQAGPRPIAESAFAGLLAGSAVFVGLREGSDNWQSMWTCAIYLLLALTLWRARAAQSPK